MPYLKNKHHLKLKNDNNKKIEINGYRRFVKNCPVGTYSGEWHNSKYNGYGTLKQNNGLVYDGQWVDGKRHGYGKIIKNHSNGIPHKLYIGQWKSNRRHGEGKYFYANGDIYHGHWDDDVRHGLGIMWYANNSIYMGSWKDNLPDGAGVLFEVNQNRYEGFFKCGKKHGEGTFYHLGTGQIQKGIWINDICKTSMVQDEFRHQVKYPSSYPISKCELLNPEHIIRETFRKYLCLN